MFRSLFIFLSLALFSCQQKTEITSFTIYCMTPSGETAKFEVTSEFRSIHIEIGNQKTGKLVVYQSQDSGNADLKPLISLLKKIKETPSTNDRLILIPNQDPTILQGSIVNNSDTTFFSYYLPDQEVDEVVISMITQLKNIFKGNEIASNYLLELGWTHFEGHFNTPDELVLANLPLTALRKEKQYELQDLSSSAFERSKDPITYFSFDYLPSFGEPSKFIVTQDRKQATIFFDWRIRRNEILYSGSDSNSHDMNTLLDLTSHILRKPRNPIELTSYDGQRCTGKIAKGSDTIYYHYLISKNDTVKQNMIKIFTELGYLFADDTVVYNYIEDISSEVYPGVFVKPSDEVREDWPLSKLRREKYNGIE